VSRCASWRGWARPGSVCRSVHLRGPWPVSISTRQAAFRSSTTSRSPSMACACRFAMRWPGARPAAARHQPGAVSVRPALGQLQALAPAGWATRWASSCGSIEARVGGGAWAVATGKRKRGAAASPGGAGLGRGRRDSHGRGARRSAGPRLVGRGAVIIDVRLSGAAGAKTPAQLESWEAPERSKVAFRIKRLSYGPAGRPPSAGQLTVRTGLCWAEDATGRRRAGSKPARAHGRGMCAWPAPRHRDLRNRR